MQLFVTYECPRLSAWALDDARVVNQCRETAQLISTALDARGIEAPYRWTHPEHPVAKWVKADLDNLAWAVDHLRALKDEHLYRFPASKEHKSAQLVLPVADMAMAQFMKEENRLTGMPSSFCNCAGNALLDLNFHHLPVHEAYRMYLEARWATSPKPVRWTRRGRPVWTTPLELM